MAEPTPAPTTDLRTTLLDQLAHLIDEVEAFKAVVGRVPEAVLAARPLPASWSIKETYGLLAALDETVHRPRLEAMTTGDDPAFDAVDQDALATGGDWNAQPIAALLDRVQRARAGLLDGLRALPPEAWTRTARFGEARRDVYGLVHAITQQDVDLLRAVGYRLHESRLSRRPRDLPK